jgi:hypothetical protein
MSRPLLFCLLLLLPSAVTALDAVVIAAEQQRIAPLPLPERIAHWAAFFVGTPYDTDPLGLYVRRRAIVADDAMDCMYHLFRSVELARSRTPAEAVEAALALRFHHHGVLRDGAVTNYDDRFEYGEDMLRSGRWGRDVTKELGATVEIAGARGVPTYRILPPSTLQAGLDRLHSGDMLYFVKPPERRVRGEVVGHLGVVRREGATVWLLHAAGRKGQGGAVGRVALSDYLDAMPFAGVMVGRF